MAQQDEKNVQGGNYPAFPMYNELGNLNAEGLTKREYFAAMAMKGIVSNSSAFFADDPKPTAEKALACADALLDALSKQ